jgi:DNA gyrase subunit A
MAEARREIVPVDIEDEMRESYMTYAMSVIMARALPDARDGLKPSQRRILVAMNDLNLGPTAQHRKCAKISGDTAGNYHPHPESIYPTLVRLGQDFNMRYPLVDPQGNFGSVDGDPPAAQRYTEARLSVYAMEMLADIDKQTVDFVPNYEETLEEPTVLPGSFPNMICNGAEGIAVGMATKMPPHNLGEVCDALIYAVDHPDCTVEELMRLLPGPDFPTGGLILGTKGIREAYETGRGTIVMQARAVIEPLDGGRQAIVVTELPYQTNKAALVERIAALHTEKKVSGISALRDESDRKGMRVVIEVKRDANPNVILNQLYRHTALRATFGVINLALVDGVPRTLPLKRLLDVYIQHRKEVILRRTRFLLDKAEARAHIVEGLRRAIDLIDEIITLIRASDNRTAAREGLQAQFGFSERQAEAIVEMQLGQLTGLDRKRLEDEHRELTETIQELRAILASEARVLEIIKDDLRALKRKYGDERRTRIVPGEADELSVEDLIAREDMAITITRDGYIKRLPVDTYRVQQRGGRGVLALTKKEEDSVEHLFVATTHHIILFFTNQGRVYRLKAYEVPAASRQSRGTPIINLVPVEPGEVVTATMPLRSFGEGGHLMMATRRGTVKKTPLGEFDTSLRARGLVAITLDDGDELKWVEWTDGKRDVMLTSRLGKTARFDEAQVRAMGRPARGVIGMRLGKNDEVVAMSVVAKDDTRDLLVVSERGLGKRTALSEYPRKGRGSQGVMTLRITDRNGPVVGSLVVEATDEIMLITSEGILIRIPVQKISRVGRAAQGVKLVAVEEGGKVRAAAKVVQSEAGDA